MYAYFGKISDLRGTDALVDSEQTKVEVWQYNPALLSMREGISDPLSVAVSLRDVDDPRVEQAIEEAINEVFRHLAEE